MGTALHSELQTHDSAALDWESGKQQAAASNPRSQSHFANRGEYQGQEKESHRRGQGMEPRPGFCNYSIYVLLAQIHLVYSKFKPHDLSAKVRKIWVYVLTHLFQNRACYLTSLTFNHLRGGDNTPLHWLVSRIQSTCPL